MRTNDGNDFRFSGIAAAHNSWPGPGPRAEQFQSTAAGLISAPVHPGNVGETFRAEKFLVVSKLSFRVLPIMGASGPVLTEGGNCYKSSILQASSNVLGGKKK